MAPRGPVGAPGESAQRGPMGPVGAPGAPQAPSATVMPDMPSDEAEDSNVLQEPERVRTEFPETWLWQDAFIGYFMFTLAQLQQTITGFRSQLKTHLFRLAYPPP